MYNSQPTIYSFTLEILVQYVDITYLKEDKSTRGFEDAIACFIYIYIMYLFIVN